MPTTTKQIYKNKSTLTPPQLKHKEKKPNKQKYVSIEYAHIYTNNNISQEQLLSIQILNKLKAKLDKKEKKPPNPPLKQ